MERLIGTLIFWLTAAFFYAILSVLKFRYDISILSKWDSFFNPEKSWRLKYKVDERDNLRMAPSNWYYRLFRVKYKERFPGSATIFVGLTDGYHSIQHMMILSLVGAVTVFQGTADTWQEYMITLIAFHFIFVIFHQICYGYLLIKKKYWGRGT